MLATFLLLFLLAELDCQSKLFFSSVAAVHFATKGGRCFRLLLQVLYKRAKQGGTWAERESNTPLGLPVHFVQFAGALIQSSLHPKHDRNCMDGLTPPTENSCG